MIESLLLDILYKEKLMAIEDKLTINVEDKLKPTDIRFEFKISFSIAGDELIEMGFTVEECKKWLDELLHMEHMNNITVTPIKMETYYD